MDVAFSEEGWEDYLHWQQHDRKVLKKISKLKPMIIQKPIKLFDPKERMNDKPAERSDHNQYDFLDKSSWPESEQIRNTLNLWFDKYPESEKKKFKKRFENKKEHSGAFFELFLHHLFLEEGFDLEPHPEIPGTQKKPDYLVKGNGVEFYLEATVASGKPESERARENREDTLINYLVDKIESPNPWWLAIEELTWKTNKQPSNKKIKQYLENEIKKIDPVRNTTKVEGEMCITDNISYEDEDIKLVIFLIIRRKGKESDISLGMGPIKTSMDGSKNSIIKAIEKKKIRYGELDKPYLICLNVTDESVDEFDIGGALDSLFSKKKNKRVSTVFITCVFHSNSLDIGKVKKWLFCNPDASKELPLKFKHQKITYLPK